MNEIVTVQLGILKILPFYLPPFFFSQKVKAVEYFIDGATVSRLMKWYCEWKSRLML